MICATCKGAGRYYSVALYYGVDDCGACDGTGIDPDLTPCPAGCGLTYRDHWERDELPEDCAEEPPAFVDDTCPCAACAGGKP